MKTSQGTHNTFTGGCLKTSAAHIEAKYTLVKAFTFLTIKGLTFFYAGLIQNYYGGRG